MIDKSLADSEWSSGTCFRCAADNVLTACVHTIATRAGEKYELRACQGCAIDLERQRRREARRRGPRQSPGRLRGGAA